MKKRGNERIRTAEKKKGKEAVASHDRLCLERTWHIKREERDDTAKTWQNTIPDAIL